MKKIFSVLAIAMMAVCSMSLISCGGSDDSGSSNNGGSNDVEEPTTVSHVFTVSDDLLKFYDITVSVKENNVAAKDYTFTASTTINGTDNGEAISCTGKQLTFTTTKGNSYTVTPTVTRKSDADLTSSEKVHFVYINKDNGRKTYNWNLVPSKFNDAFWTTMDSAIKTTFTE